MDKTVVSKRLLSTIEEKGMSYGEVAKLTEYQNPLYTDIPPVRLLKSLLIGLKKWLKFLALVLPI